MSKKRSIATEKSNARRAAERAAAIRKEQEAKERRRRTLTVTVVVLVVLTVLLGIGYAVQSSRDTTGQVATPPDGVVEKYAFPFGDPTAPVKVAVYEDFMCPFCGQFEAVSKDMLERYVDQGDVEVRYHVISFLDGSSNTDYSTRAANAAGVVLDTTGPEAAKKFHDLLYANQPEEGSDGLSDDQLIEFAVEAGAQESDVRQPIEDLKFEQWVKNATEESSKQDVATTPTVMVDGESVDFETLDDLLASTTDAIESALNN